jgi:hypothetical protein
MTSPARIENTERKRETSLANQVAAIKARREAEQTKLRTLLDDIVERRTALEAREAEVRAMLGEAVVVAYGGPAGGGMSDASPLMMAKCVDCERVVPLKAPDVLPDECPYCTASPFEVAP